MKKIQINHRVEIQNNVLGFMYLVLQITEFDTNETENEVVEVRCYDLKTTNEVFRNEMRFALYPMAKKQFKKVILKCLPV